MDLLIITNKLNEDKSLDDCINEIFDNSELGRNMIRHGNNSIVIYNANKKNI